MLARSRKALAGVGLVAMLAGAFLAACAPAADGLAVGDQAPAFELPSTAGNRVALADYQGQPVLLFFHMAVG